MSKNTPKPVAPVEIVEEELYDALVEDLAVDEATDVAVYEAVPAVETVSPVSKADTYVAKDGDSYASIAAEFNTTKLTKFQYAQFLMALNGGKAIVAGSEVRLG
jgi:LysM repeat protein